MKILNLKTIINKKNGQVNISLPKRKLPLSMKSKLKDIKRVKIKIEGFE